MKHVTLSLLAAGLVLAVLAAPAQAQRRGGWSGGGYRGGYGGWSGGYGGYRGGYGGWYGGTGLYTSPYRGGYYSPYAYNYGLYNQPYYGSYYTYSPTYPVPYDSTSMMYTAPSDATVAQTQSYQSFYNAPAANTNQVTVHVTVPQAGARVWVDNRLTEQQGTDRLFVSPTLQPGQQYSYSIRASWLENGREVSRQKTVTFSPGQQVAVNFLDTGDSTITEVLPTQPATRPAGSPPGAADRPSGITPATRPPADNPGDDRRPDRSTSGSPAPGRSTVPPPPPIPPAPKEPVETNPK